MSESESTKEYWRSIADLERTPEFQEMVEREFPGGPDQEWTKSSRRRFLQVMGASVALGAATSCRWKEERILPLADRPEGRVPGKPEHFATMLEHGGKAQPVTVTCYEGRPTKVEGNALHPESLGATNVWSQAATLELYDPDRSRTPWKRGAGHGELAADEEEGHAVSWEDFEAEVGPALAKMRAGVGRDGILVIAEPSDSPTYQRLKRDFQRTYRGSLWTEYTPLERRNELEGCRSAFNLPCRPRYRLDAARVLLTLDDDLLTHDPSAVRLTREYSARRDPDGEWMNRHYAVESDFSTTGACADHRLPLRAGAIGAFLAALEARLVDGGMEHPDAEGARAAAEGVQIAGAGDFLDAVAGDLLAHRGEAVITVGENQPPEVHARAQRLNVLLEARGATVDYVAAPTGGTPLRNLKSALGGIGGGKFHTVLILGGNPVYDMPADVNIVPVLQELPRGNRIHLSRYRNETSRMCEWHLPMAHDFEAWTDGKAADGSTVIGQPLIEPIWGGRGLLDFLSWWNGSDARGEELLRATHEMEDAEWRRALHDGVVAGSAAEPLRVQLQDVPAYEGGAPAAHPANGELEVNFEPCNKLWDGRFANLGWLQELPDPMTKITWDNAVLMSFRTAEELGVENETMVRLELGRFSIEGPAWLMPGHADGCVTVKTGYGRTHAGHVAGLNDDWVSPVGYDAYALRTDEFGMGFASGVTVTPLGTPFRVASTQDHHAIDEIGEEGRERRLPELVKEADREEYERDPLFAKSAADYWGPESNLWDELPESANHKWGMAVDLSKCTGCSACTIACQSENNIPVVGKEQVLAGREMHWIRMDRYFKGDRDNPEAVNQPVACQQCEMAPCESVCPVAATTHTSEGLNDMVYNRCIGTRYCSNNCPYKVRRFNFFNFRREHKNEDNEVLDMVNNPEVTVRSRGVMEKCTFCVQRIERARIETRNEDRHARIPDGEIQTACQQVCPAGAIEFGDLMDGDSKVRQAHENPRAYGLLAALNVKPRNQYLARVRNPHPSLDHEPASGHGEEVRSHG